MAQFRRSPIGRAWVVIDLPVGTRAGDRVSVLKKDGSISSVLVKSVIDFDGTPVATIAREPRAGSDWDE